MMAMVRSATKCGRSCHAPLQLVNIQYALLDSTHPLLRTRTGSQRFARRRFRILAALCSAVLLAACAGAPLNARRLDDPQATTSKVVVTSPHLHAALRAAAVRIERNDDNFLEIEVHVLNDSAKPVPVQFRIVFRDHLNKEVERREVPPVVIPPGKTHILTATSRVLPAQEFTVEVLDAKR